MWLPAFRFGSEVGEVEIEAYLHHALGLSRFERDLLAHAGNELVDHGPDRHAPTPPRPSPAPGRRPMAQAGPTVTVVQAVRPSTDAACRERLRGGSTIAGWARSILRCEGSQ